MPSVTLRSQSCSSKRPEYRPERRWSASVLYLDRTHLGLASRDGIRGIIDKNKDPQVDATANKRDAVTSGRSFVFNIAHDDLQCPKRVKRTARVNNPPETGWAVLA